MAGHNQLGTKRYLRYVDAFDHVIKCSNRGYHLEAIAVLDSLIGDRLSSRLGHLLKAEVSVHLSVGQLCSRLLLTPAKNAIPVEVDSAFQAATRNIRDWVKKRNIAMHATAKIIRDDEDTRDLRKLLKSHRIIVEDGIALLQAFDKLDTAARQTNGKHPATWPSAFFPEKRRDWRRTR